MTGQAKIVIGVGLPKVGSEAWTAGKGKDDRGLRMAMVAMKRRIRGERKRGEGCFVDGVVFAIVDILDESCRHICEEGGEVG